MNKFCAVSLRKCHEKWIKRPESSFNSGKNDKKWHLRQKKTKLLKDWTKITQNLIKKSKNSEKIPERPKEPISDQFTSS